MKNSARTTALRPLLVLSALALAATSQAFASLIDDAVVFYTFEEGSGSAINDVSNDGNDIDLQLGGSPATPTRTTGYNGEGLSFDGDDFVTSITDVTPLDFDADDAFSVAGWFRRTKEDGGTQKNLLAKMETSGPYPGWFLAWRDEDIGSNQNSILFYMRDNEGSTGNGALAVYSNAVDSTDWIHIAATYDGSSNPSGVNFYLNGAVLDTRDSADDLEDNDITDNTAPFNIGGRNGTGSWVGDADEVGVWNRELSASEIETLTTIIPEPASALLLALGGLALLKRRR